MTEFQLILAFFAALWLLVALAAAVGVTLFAAWMLFVWISGGE